MQDHECVINCTTSLSKERFHLVYWMPAEATTVRERTASLHFER